MTDNNLDFMDHARAVREQYEASTTPEEHAARLRSKFARYRAERDEALTKSATGAQTGEDESLTKSATGAQTAEPVMTCKKCGQDKVASLMSVSNGKPRNLCKSCEAERTARHRSLTKSATATQAGEDGSHTPAESWADRVNRHHERMQGRAWFKGLPVPRDANDDQPTGQAEGWYMTVSNSSRYVTRAVAFQIARLAGDDSVVTISRNSLAEAVGQVGKMLPRAATDMGLKDLEKRGWVEQDGQTIRLTVGEEIAPEVVLDWTYTPTERHFPVAEDATWIETIRSMFAEIENTWLTENELDAHIANCSGCEVCV